MSLMPTNKATQLFLIMKDRKYRYCIYRVGDLEQVSGDESSSVSFDEPLLKLDKSVYPNGMSFMAFGTSIYMVGGYYSRDSNNPFRLSDKTFIYDTLSDTIASGPTLVSPKAEPLLITLGSRIYAVSRNIYSYDRKSSAMDPKPRFEVLDTDNPSHGWSPLPLPRLVVSRQNDMYSIEAYAALGNSCAILISVEDAGTYAFDVYKMDWSYVSDDSLPFHEYAIPIPPSLGFPHASSLFYARSIKSKAYSAFRLHYYADDSDVNNRVYRFEEIEIDNSPLLSPLPPPKIYHGCSVTVFDPNGQIYSVMSGSDNISAINTYHGNRYVKIIALDICNARHKKRRRLVGHDEEPSESPNVRHVLRKCTEKKPSRNDEETEVGSKVRHVLRRCSKKKPTRNDQETEEFAMSRIWAKSFFEGPTCHVQEPISAVFAM